MRSASTTRATSATVAFIACCIRTAASRLDDAATLRREAGKIAEHHPPLRPEAPNPATSRSSTATRNDGSATAR